VLTTSFQQFDQKGIELASVLAKGEGRSGTEEEQNAVDSRRKRVTG
jgi:hypothetical protein